jgi:hypothetical protein
MIRSTSVRGLSMPIFITTLVIILGVSFVSAAYDPPVIYACEKTCKFVWIEKNMNNPNGFIIFDEASCIPCKDLGGCTLADSTTTQCTAITGTTTRTLYYGGYVSCFAGNDDYVEGYYTGTLGSSLGYQGYYASTICSFE